MQTFSRKVDELMETRGWTAEKAIQIVASGGYEMFSGADAPVYVEVQCGNGISKIGVLS